MSSQARWFLNPLFGDNYKSKLLGIQRANLLAYWPLQELSGTNAENAENTAARDGTYVGVALNNSVFSDGTPVGFFDGADDHVNIYSASLASAFNGALGTAAAWLKVTNAGIWTDGSNDYALQLWADGDNMIYFRKHSSNNTFAYYTKAGGTAKAVSKSSVSTTDWFHVAATWSEAADQVIYYYNGAQEGATQSGLGTFAGSLDSSNTNIGSWTTTPSNPFNGWICHVAIWNAVLTPAQITILATV